MYYYLMIKKVPVKSLTLFILLLLILGCSMPFGNEQTYEDDLYPHILEQINDTAGFFYYNRAGIHNAIKGPKEVPGVCNDYASHFVDHYKGPGEVYRMVVSTGGDAALERRVKVFEKSDIKFSTQERIDTFYTHIMTGNSNRTPPINWSSTYTYYNQPESQSFDFHTNRYGVLYVVDKIPVPTPLSHAGRTTGFYNHAWVRIIWNGITVDIDPTWYDNGLSLSYVIRVIN